MDLFEAFILGLVQGATEYLPVSSSGHLVLVPNLMGWKKAPFVFDILVQMGTLLGVVIYYWKDLVEIAQAMIKGVIEKKPFADPVARLGWLVGLATIPAGVLGILVKDHVEEIFQSVRFTMGFLLLTALLLVVGEVFGKRVRDGNAVTLLDSIVIGFAQALALFPGVSRSGSTIAAGMVLGINRSGAARFSFLMSIPVMVGAGMLAIKDLIDNPAGLTEHGPAIAVGFVTSAISGYLIIKWFLHFLKHKSLLWFAAYCGIVGTLGLIFFDAPS